MRFLLFYTGKMKSLYHKKITMSTSPPPDQKVCCMLFYANEDSRLIKQIEKDIVITIAIFGAMGFSIKATCIFFLYISKSHIGYLSMLREIGIHLKYLSLYFPLWVENLSYKDISDIAIVRLGHFQGYEELNINSIDNEENMNRVYILIKFKNNEPPLYLREFKNIKEIVLELKKNLSLYTESENEEIDSIVSPNKRENTFFVAYSYILMPICFFESILLGTIFSLLWYKFHYVNFMIHGVLRAFIPTVCIAPILYSFSDGIAHKRKKMVTGILIIIYYLSTLTFLFHHAQLMPLLLRFLSEFS